MGEVDMGDVEWNLALETGNAQIDGQHQALVAAFNRFSQAVAAGRGHTEVRETLLFLTGYTMQHFRMEEGLMEQAGFPDTERHRKLHYDLVVQLAGLMKALEQRSPQLAPLTLEFLRGWLVEHIQGEDLRLAEFLRARAVPPE